MAPSAGGGGGGAAGSAGMADCGVAGGAGATGVSGGAGGIGAELAGGGGGGGGTSWAIRLPANNSVPAARAVNSGLRDFIIDTPCQNVREVVRVSAPSGVGFPLPVAQLGKHASRDFVYAGSTSWS